MPADPEGSGPRRNSRVSALLKLVNLSLGGRGLEPALGEAPVRGPNSPGLRETLQPRPPCFKKAVALEGVRQSRRSTTR